MIYKKLVQKAILFSLVSLNCVSCATIVNGTTQKIPVSSDPIGASVFVDGVPVGYTPLNIELKRKHTHLVTVSHEGYEDEAVRLEPVLSAVVAGNIIAGGFVGWGVDAVSGSQYRLIPDAVFVRLKPYANVPYAPIPFQPPYAYPDAQ